MASSTVFDLISVSLGKSLETIIIPNFVDVAVTVASGFGDEPPSKDSMKLLFEDAFKKALSNPGKKASSKAKTSNKEEKKEKKEKKASPKPKVKKAPAPKPQWLSLVEMKEKLSEEKTFFCGFVADRGPNKGKFCATVLSEEHNNCGVLTEDGWVPHTPEKELESVGGSGASMRCKKCWSKGKNGCYRKEGVAEKMYSEEFSKVQVPDLPEVPEVPNDDISEPEENEVNEEQDEEQDEYQCNTDDEDNEGKEEDDDVSTDDLLEGLIDDEPLDDILYDTSVNN